MNHINQAARGWGRFSGNGGDFGSLKARYPARLCGRGWHWGPSWLGTL